MATHPFEKSGLGRAPFRLVHMEVRVGPMRTTLSSGVVVESGAPGQPMGTCQHCGMGIKYVCVIKDADGNISEVGTTCVEKCGKRADSTFQDIGLASDVEYVRRNHTNRIRRAKAAAKKAEAKRERERKRRVRAIRDAKAFLRTNPGLGDALSHKNNRAIRSLRENLAKWGSLSEAQINLAKKIAAQEEAS